LWLNSVAAMVFRPLERTLRIGMIGSDETKTPLSD